MLGVPVFGWVIALVLSASLCALQYFKLIRDSGGWKSGWIWAGACRFLTWFTLILLLFNPWWIRVSQWVQDPVLLVYTDASKSISAEDQARWLNIKSTIEKTQGVKVQAYSASDAVVVQGQSRGLNPYHTNLSSVIQHANQVATNMPVAGVVWFTDGINNEGRNPQFEPFVPGIPLVAVGAGDANPQIDASVEAVQCNDEAFLGNSFSVEISVKSQRLKSQPLKIQLKAGADIKEVLWVPSSDQDWKRIAFEIKPKVKGQLPLKVSVSGGKGDENRANNERVKNVKVVDEKKKSVDFVWCASSRCSGFEIGIGIGWTIHCAVVADSENGGGSGCLYFAWLEISIATRIEKNGRLGGRGESPLDFFNRCTECGGFGQNNRAIGRVSIEQKLARSAATLEWQ